ncbi:MAG: anaerobic C4-dicarboxylate transporter family protein [Gammaproteobacteria bacterium]|jgi:anaerobic C4-dicarboxylate transporter-like protein|nr:anaerobic C4-dicarboxylate transporter family protein [Gammaproteobacteria bacterium]
MFFFQLAILLLCIVIGARLGGIALGTVSGIGLAFFMVVLGMPPGNPPAVVLGMILAVITALSMMEAAGGMDFLVLTAEKLLRKNPRRITVLAPLITYLLIFAAGTQHVIYSLLPVIAEVSTKAGVRPERAMSMSVIAAQHGLIASPVSAATVALLAALVTLGASLGQILMVTIPATLFGVAMGILSVAWKGRELADDPEAQQRLAEVTAVDAHQTTMEEAARKRGMGSCMVFLGGVAVVVLFGLFPALRPSYTALVDGVPVSTSVDMGRVIMIVMLAAAGLITLLFKASPAAAVQGKLMRGGLVAIISILGVSWLGSSFFTANEETIVGTISAFIGNYPWVFALGLFVLSILLFSQAATIVILAPVGVALGMPLHLLIGVYPAVNGNFFLPTYGTVLAAVSFDQTGTTKIGKYLLNHSFMIPGLVTTVSATCAGLVLAALLL